MVARSAELLRASAIGAVGVCVASSSAAGVFTPVSQSRVVRADDHHVTTGFTCIDLIGGRPFPDCPVSLVDVTSSHVQIAPGFVPDPFAVEAAVEDAAVSHVSSIQPTAITASGSGSAAGYATPPAEPAGYLLVFDHHGRSILDTTTITVALDEATPFTFEASGRIVYPDPSFPLVWDVDIQISLEGPTGPVPALSVAHGYTCPDGDPGLFVCWVEPPQQVVIGTLPAGEYTLQVVMVAEGNGSWWPSVGALGAGTNAEYDVALSLGGPAPRCHSWDRSASWCLQACSWRVRSGSIHAREIPNRPSTGGDLMNRSSEPSVKGSIFASVAEDIRRALAERRLERADLEAALDEKDLPLLDDVVTAVSWMPIASYGRMLELLAKVEGGSGREAYLRDRGGRAAEKLLAGTYHRFEAKPGEWGPKSGELMTGIASVLYDFTKWRFGQIAPGEWEIVANAAAAFPDAAAHTAHGFLDWYANRASPTPIETRLSRPTPDCIVFRLRERG